MATKPNDDKFDFEIEDDEAKTPPKADDKPKIEVEDDTPPEDRGREPMPGEIVKQLEALDDDELEKYSAEAKQRVKQLQKVWHDERREKERTAREQAEAVDFARRVLDENRRLKETLSLGEKTLVTSYSQTAEAEASEARRAYREAYEAGDAEKQIEASEKLNRANYRLEQLRNYIPTVQPEENIVQNPVNAAQPPRPDPRTTAWQERNTWFGTDPEMTATALGLHQKLQNQHGAQHVGTDEYWQSIDMTMQRRFPEYFGEATAKPAARSSTVVAPATRSTSSKKIVLKQSQVDLAKRLGLTPEQYAREYAKVEKQNG
jgi:hypothetical protein